jgi:hypothetical protein
LAQKNGFENGLSNEGKVVFVFERVLEGEMKNLQSRKYVQTLIGKSSEPLQNREEFIRHRYGIHENCSNK